ncbi:hypothetical protein ACFL1P_01655 [Patescibacteria group bacterium]
MHNPEVYRPDLLDTVVQQDFINNHPKDVVERVVTSTRMTKSTCDALNPLYSDICEDDAPRFSPDDEVHPYKAYISIPTKDIERPTLHKIGIFYLTGMLGSGPGTGDFVRAVSEQEQDKSGERPFVAGISSSISVDTGEATLPSIEKRTAQMAAFIVEILQKNPCKEIVLVGHSLGVEMFYALPALQKLIEHHGLDTKIKATVISQGAGLFEQSAFQFIHSLYKEGKQRTAIDLLYPTSEVISSYEVRRREALRVGDEGEVRVLSGLISLMRKRLTKPELAYLREESLLRSRPLDAYRFKRNSETFQESHDTWEYLTAEEKEQLNELDFELVIARRNNDTRQVKRLRNRRYSLLATPIYRNMSGPDIQKGSPLRLNSQSVWNALKTGGQTLRVMPEWVRQRVDWPVGMIWGENDLFYPSERALKSREQWTRKQRKKAERHLHMLNIPDWDEQEAERINQYVTSTGILFPHAPKVIEATITGWPHASFANVDLFAGYVLDVLDTLDTLPVQDHTTVRTQIVDEKIRYGGYPEGYKPPNQRR